MCISKISITSILLLNVALSGCSVEKPEKEESMNYSTNKINQTSQQETPGNPNATKDLGLSKDTQKIPQDTPELLVLEGQVLFQQIEGGFFSFIDEDGNKYTPVGMEKSNLRHGLIIQLTGELLPDMITTTQFGQVIKVQSVKIIDESDAQDPGRPNLSNGDL